MWHTKQNWCICACVYSKSKKKYPHWARRALWANIEWVRLFHLHFREFGVVYFILWLWTLKGVEIPIPCYQHVNFMVLIRIQKIRRKFFGKFMIFTIRFCILHYSIFRYSVHFMMPVYIYSKWVTMDFRIGKVSLSSERAQRVTLNNVKYLRSLHTFIYIYDAVYIHTKWNQISKSILCTQILHGIEWAIIPTLMPRYKYANGNGIEKIISVRLHNDGVSLCVSNCKCACVFVFDSFCFEIWWSAKVTFRQANDFLLVRFQFNYGL